jgi:hypothetical protein
MPRDDRWLSSLMGGFLDNGVAGVYGKQVAQGEVNPFEALKNELFFGQAGIKFNARDVGKGKSVHFSNSNGAIRKDIWEKFRFNEEVGWAEDILWQEEVMAAGYSIVYSPEASVYHTHPPNLARAYKSSRDCAFALARMEGKRKGRYLAIYDTAVMLGSFFDAVVRNLVYVWRRGHFRYLITVPAYVLSSCIGWLCGRVNYRMS